MPSNSTQTILVTGGNGFIAVHILVLLFQRGHTVITTVRSQDKTEFLKEKFASQYSDGRLRFNVVPDITADGAFDDVFKSEKVESVLHVSSPYHFNVKDVRTELLEPAIKGTRGILESISRLAPTVKQVVITSSFAAITDPFQGTRPGYVYSEKDWNPITFEKALEDPLKGYYGSKKFAEKAAWEFMEEHKPSFKIVTICPPLVYGPAIQHVESTSKLNQSNSVLYKIFNGEAVPTQSTWTWVDVRDVALAHVDAIERLELGNERFLVTEGTWSTQTILDYIWKHYPERAEAKGISKGTPGRFYPETGTYTVDNSKSKRLLGLDYIGFETMLADLFKSFEALEEAEK